MTYQMKDFQDPSLMMAYLNELPPHEIVTCLFDQNGYWRTIVKLLPGEEPAKKQRMVRPKGWKPGQPYVPMEDK